MFSSLVRRRVGDPQHRQSLPVAACVHALAPLFMSFGSSSRRRRALTSSCIVVAGLAGDEPKAEGVQPLPAPAPALPAPQPPQASVAAALSGLSGVFVDAQSNGFRTSSVGKKQVIILAICRAAATVPGQKAQVQMKKSAPPVGGALFLRTHRRSAQGDETRHQQAHHAHDFDENGDARARGVLEGVADHVADDGGLVHV